MKKLTEDIVSIRNPIAYLGVGPYRNKYKRYMGRNEKIVDNMIKLGCCFLNNIVFKR